MPQEHHIVRCYKCETFQVQIVKKVKKFECKMCGEKQSLKKEYGRGSGKDCRLHLQKLRDLQVQNETKEISSKLSEIENNLELYSDEEETYPTDFNQIENSPSNETKNQNSKWSEFIETKESSESDDQVDPEYSKFTFERPTKRKKSNFNGSRTKRPAKKSAIEKEPNDLHYNESNNLPQSMFERVHDSSNNQDHFINSNSENSYSSGISLEKNIRNTKPSKWNNFVASDSSDSESQIGSSLEIRSPSLNNQVSNFVPRINNFNKLPNQNKSKSSKWDNFVNSNNSDEDEPQIDQNSPVSNQNINPNSVLTINKFCMVSKKSCSAKPSKWDNFLVSEPQSVNNCTENTPDSDEPSQTPSQPKLLNEKRKILQNDSKSIFKTVDDDNLDDILDF